MSGTPRYKHCFGDGENQAPHMALLEAFGKDACRSDGLSAYCKLCAATRQRAWKHANPEKVRAAKREYRAKRKESQCAP